MSRFIRDEVMAAIIAKAGVGTCDDGTPIRRVSPTQLPANPAREAASTVSTTGTVHIGVVNVYYGVKAPDTPE